MTFVIINNENSFSLTCERKGATQGGSVNVLAKKDFKIFKNLFHFDFSEIEKQLDIDCFSIITDYTAIEKREQMYNKTVSKQVQYLSEKIALAKDENEAVVDMEIIVKFGTKVQKVAAEVQEKVKSTVETMTGLNVAVVNVSISGVVKEAKAEEE